MVEQQDMSPEQMAEAQKQNCIFCKIIKGEIPSKKVYEDEEMLAILDINPAVAGHMLVMPKEHVPLMPMIPQKSFLHIFAVVRQLVKAQKEAVLNPYSTVFIANGAAAGQQSPHFLFHVIPRENTDAINLELSSGTVSDAEIEETVTKVKARLQQMLGVGPSQDNRQKLAELIDSDAEIRKLLTEDIPGLKKRLEKDPELAALFAGFDLEKLSERLKAAQQQPEVKEAEFEDIKEEETEEEGDSEEEDDAEEETEESDEGEEPESEEKDKKEGADLDDIAGLFE